MNNPWAFACLLAALLLAVAAPRPLTAQDAARSAPDLIRVTVTVSGTHGSEPPALALGDIVVRQDNEVRPVISWARAQGASAKLDLAILVDDALDPNVSIQYPDLKNFIRRLPSTVRVAVAYGTLGNAQIAQNFTADHDLTIKALRLPLGRIDDGSSIYLALADLLKHWPANGSRHEVLLISDGIDLFRGVADSAPTSGNIDLQQAVNEAQRAGVNIFTLFADGAGRIRRNYYLVSNGQGSLALLSVETGGDSYTQGFRTPVSFGPFLKQFSKALASQYLLTFKAALSQKAHFARLRLATEQHGVELDAPRSVFVPAKQ